MKKINEYVEGDSVFCSTQGCFGAVVEVCPDCDGLLAYCPCGCSSFDSCMCDRNEEPGE